MHRYKNKLTGQMFETPCICAGENWEEVKKPVKKEAKRSGKKKKAVPDD